MRDAAQLSAESRGSGGNSPFVAAILGHWSIDEPPESTRLAAVAAFVGDLKRHLPNTELKIIVGVTSDFDLSIMQAVMDSGAAVEAVLPASCEACLPGLDTLAGATLQRLLRHPRFRWSVLPSTVWGRPITDEDASRRSADYAVLTAALIRRSCLLLTLWDHHLPQSGGVADSSQRHVGVRIDEQAGASLVMLDETPDADTPDELIRWSPGGTASPSMPPELRRLMAEFDGYNLDFQELRTEGVLKPPDSLLASLPPTLHVEARAELESIDEQYGKADALALHYQVLSDRLFGLFGAMAFVMGLAYLVYDKITHASMLLFAYLLVLMLSLIVYYALRGKQWFARHLTYRALAETLRVTFYLRLAGLDHRIDTARVIEMSGIRYFKGFNLITDVLAAVSSRDTGAQHRVKVDSQTERLIEETWIASQYRYFAAKVGKLERNRDHMGNLKNVLFAVIVLVIVAMSLSDEFMENTVVGYGVSLKNLVTFGDGLLALMLGVWGLHDAKMARRELLWQYRNQRNHFARARRQLASPMSLSERTAILVGLGRDSLMESYLWTIHRYHREHEPPGKK